MIRNDLLFGSILQYYGFASECKKLIMSLSKKTQSYNQNYPDLIDSTIKHKFDVDEDYNVYQVNDVDGYDVVYHFREIN